MGNSMRSVSDECNEILDETLCESQNSQNMARSYKRRPDTEIFAVSQRQDDGSQYLDTSIDVTVNPIAFSSRAPFANLGSFSNHILQTLYRSKEGKLSDD